MFDFEEVNEQILQEEVYSTSFNLCPGSPIDSVIERMTFLTNYSEIETVEQAKEALTQALMARKMASDLTQDKKNHVKKETDYIKAVSRILKNATDRLEDVENRLTARLKEWIENCTNIAYSSGLMGICVEEGSAKLSESWAYEIQDPCSIPSDYICVNEKAVEKAIASGVRNIPGIKIFTKRELKLRAKSK